MRLSPIHRRDLIKSLRALGWEGPFAGGKHEFMCKGQIKLPIPNPHGSGEISVAKLQEILKEIGVDRKTWVKVQLRHG
jgi:predicted RNA binding protein YcfA (HicA-like mRNA interferase family)